MNRVAAIPLAFCVLPLLATGWRGWRWLTGVGLVCLAALAAWCWLAVASAGPDVHGLVVAVMLGVVLGSALALAAGSAGRAAGLDLQARGRSRGAVLWTDLLALAAAAAPLLFFGIL